MNAGRCILYLTFYVSSMWKKCFIVYLWKQEGLYYAYVCSIMAALQLHCIPVRQDTGFADP